MTHLILFDIDGTLIHTHHAGVNAFYNTFRSEFKIENPSDRIHFAGRTDRSLVREFFQFHQIEASETNFQRFFDCYVFWLDYMLKKSEGEICQGADSFVSNLLKLDNPPMIGLLTGNIRLGAEIKLRHFYLWNYFEMGAFGDEEENRNTLALRAFEKGRKILGSSLTPEDVIVVGDTILDVKCAKAIGAKSLAVATGGATFEELQAATPTWCVPALGQISPQNIL